ncbi:MAG TPA: haloacid dehalogenase-like hydrolase [Acidobacteriaceae bacterium]|nr:haloacid dehalogenase-like hydrolase [Acidobacteriaceae bacterium]
MRRELGALQEYSPALTSIQSILSARISPEKFAHTVLSLRPAVAVFDCDGTLWNDDAGYEFMLWSIAEGIVSRNASDWIDSRYRLYRAGEVTEIAMCGEMVQIYDGLREAEVRKAAAEFFQTRIAGKIFPEMLQLVHDLQQAGSEIWAVSSTNNWVIEEGLRGFHIPAERILAARVQVTGGVITSRLLDIPSDEGKAMSLARAGVLTPDAVFGNSIHDGAMLQIARYPFAVNPTMQLLKLAAQNGWLVFYPKAVMPEQA